MRLKPLWALLVAAPLAAAAPAPETYTIKLNYRADAGKSYVVKDTDTASNSVTVSDADGKVLQQQKSKTEDEAVYTTTIIEKGDKRPTKFKRAYEKASRTTDGKKAARPFEGRTVLFELKDGKYQVSAEGTPAIDQGALDELAEKVNGTDDGDEILLPKKPVKVGDKWALDAKAMEKSFAKDGKMALDPEKSKGEGTLVKVYLKDGKQYGVVEYTIKLAIKSAGEVKFEAPATMDVKATMDAVIDGSSGAGRMTMTGKMEGRGVVTQGDQKITVELSAEMFGKTEKSPEK